MNINRINSQKGIAQFLVIAVMALMALGIPTVTNLVQKNQENRSKATEENNFSCNTLRDIHKNYFDVCKDFDNICFNKLNGEYQGCGNIVENNGGDCTDPNHNMNAASNILCSIKSDISLSCDTLYEKKQKYFAICAEGKNTGVCFNKQTGEYRGCDNENNCGHATLNSNSDDLNKIFCSVKESDSSLWTDEAGICGTAHEKTFEATPTENLCEKGDVSRIFFDSNSHRYSWKCGDVEKLGNQTANCNAIVNGVPGSSKVTLDRETLNLGIGQSLKINATLTPPNSTDKIVWTSNLPDFFSVDSNGVIKTLKESASGDITAMTLKGQGASLRVNTSIYKDKIDAKCGSSHGKILPVIPENYLCQQSSVIYGQLKGNKYYWTCSGENGGSSADCEATINNNVVSPPTKLTPTPPPISIPGAYLYFSPQNQSHKIGDTFEVAVGVNSASSIIGGADVVGNYDSSKLELISIKKSPSMVFGTKGDCAIPKDIITGKFSLTCFITNSWESMVAKGDLIKLTFRAKSTGSAKIQFACEKNNDYDSNIIPSDRPEDLIVCDKNINANIVITNSTLTKIDGKCNTSFNKCLSGTFKDLPDSTTLLVWQCSGSNGGKSVKCSIKHNLTTPPPKITPEINENGDCGDVTKIITNTCVSGNPIDLPDTLNEYIWECKGAKTTQRCVKIKGSDDDLCPKNQFNHLGKCENDLEIGWGCDRDGVCISGKCDLTTNRCVNKNFKTPATNIRISPLGLSLKVGQNKNLTYILTPSNTTDTIKWSTTGNGQVRIQKITLKCADNPNAKCMDAPGINNLLVTGLKAGTVKIKLTTSSGKTAQATVVVQK